MVDSNQSSRCQYSYKKDGETVQCSHSVWKNGYCIFHHQDVAAKQGKFDKALQEYIELCEQENSINRYDFHGFIFPQISFAKKEFIKLVDFSSSQFRGDAYFSSSQFRGDAYFSESQFSGNAYFSESQFSGDAYFSSSQFRGDAYFSSSQFSGGADFRSSQFSGDADFRSSLFSGYTSFSSSQFSGGAYFSESQFRGDAYFRSSQFRGDAYFRSSQFRGDADFSSSQFRGDASFSESQFSGNASFSESQFSSGVSFSSSQFRGYASFSSSQFNGDADFSESQFSSDTDFNESTFKEIVRFQQSSFEKRLQMKGAAFHNEVQMNQARISFVKNLQTAGVQFEGSVLEETHFWGIDTLDGYSFRNAFLLSLSLAGKKIINCDFTGAVIGAVHTLDWQPDEQTLAKTKYIYSDYSVELKDGKKVYHANLDSRVPADGHFGESEHKDFTLAKYLLEPHKWSFALDLPAAFRTSVINYIQFFHDFIRMTEDVEIQILTKPEGSKIRVEFQTETEEQKALVQNKFKDYLESGKQGVDFNNDLQLKGSASDVEKQLFLIEYKSQIRNLQDKLEHTQLLLQQETQLLEQEKKITQLQDKLLKKSESAEKTEKFIESFQNSPAKALVPPRIELYYCLQIDLKGSSEDAEKHNPQEMNALFTYYQEEVKKRSPNMLDDPGAGDGIFV